MKHFISKKYFLQSFRTLASKLQNFYFTKTPILVLSVTHWPLIHSTLSSTALVIYIVKIFTYPKSLQLTSFFKLLINIHFFPSNDKVQKRSFISRFLTSQKIIKKEFATFKNQYRLNFYQKNNFKKYLQIRLGLIDDPNNQKLSLKKSMKLGLKSKLLFTKLQLKELKKTQELGKWGS